MRASHSIAILLASLFFTGLPAVAVNFLDSADPAHNTSTPGDNSGWQFQGKFQVYLGVPISPYHFITAAHIGGAVGDILDFHGESYTTIAAHPVAGTDLMIWEVDHVNPFPTYAALSSGAADIGAVATVIGRGKPRGAEVFLGTDLKGWNSGTSDGVQRWGRNIIKGETNDVLGKLLYGDFDNPGIPDECHLSVGDSGGGLWVLEDGLWRLAGINYAVDGPFRLPPAGAEMRDASLFDAGGLEYKDSGAWILLTDNVMNNPVTFYCSRISAYQSEIRAIIGGDGTLAAEGFGAWQRLYFTPSEIALAGVSGSLSDADGDGICNLLEYALNLEPKFGARTGMVAGTGLSGLPLVAMETLSGSGRLTLEFVRRVDGMESGLIYTPQFGTTLGDWVAGGEETVTAINTRWERVKVVDPAAEYGSPRFARLKVTLGN